MRHWAFTLDAARSIVAAKAKEMDEQKWIFAIVIGCILVSALVEIFKTSKKHSADEQYLKLPPGAIIVYPKGE